MLKALMVPQRMIKDEKTGFISREDIIPLLDRLCSEIKYPITLIYLDSKNNFCRIDSARVGFVLDQACDTFRKFGGYEKCIYNDNKHAEPYLLGLKAMPEKGYEMYKCKYMGYQEYIFPIEIENTIVAVLFVGQIKVQNDFEVSKVKEKCISKYLNIFASKLNQIKLDSQINIQLDDIKRRILSSDIDPFQLIDSADKNDINRSHRIFLNSSDVDSFIQEDVLPHISKFKKSIEDELLEYRKQYIAEEITRFEEEYNNAHINFIKNFDSSEENQTALISDYWSSLECFFVELKKKFELKELTYFEQKKVINKISSDIYIKKISTEKNEYDNEIKLTDIKVRSQPYILDERAQLRYILKVEFFDETKLSNKLKKFLFLELKKAMMNTMDICSYAIYSKFESSSNLTTLRIYRHEMDQLILTLGGINYKLSPKYKEELDWPKIEKMHKDFTSSLELATYLSENMGHFTTIQRGIKLSFDPKEQVRMFGDGLLNKWRLLLVDDIIKKHCEIIIPDDDARRKRDAGYDLVYCVPKGLELILYNIINNAIKYCHRGTNIYLDCNYFYDSNNRKRHKITIVDYGKGLSPLQYEDIFKLYYRDIGAGTNIEGSGIGLYISNVIAESIGVSIHYKSQLISCYNVPLIDGYIDLLNSPKNKLHDEKKRISLLRTEKITSDYYSKIVPEGIENGIMEPTYKVTFEVII